MLKHLRLLSFFFLFIHGKVQAQVPIEFIENQGQWDAPFSYKASFSSTHLFFRKDGIRISLEDEKNIHFDHPSEHSNEKTTLNFFSYDILFLKSNKNVQISGAKPQKHYYNYYLGNESSKWKSAIHPNLALDYKNLYDGIDAHIYTDNNNFKYDFIVKRNANTANIQMQYVGPEKVEIKNELLVITTSIGEVKELKPYTYQIIEGEKKEVKAKYVLNDNIVSFSFPKGYNKNYDLIIDPTLVFCSFTGSTADNWGYTATYDSSGNLYAGGIVGYSFPNPGVFSGNYPVTTGAFQSTFGGGGPGGMGNLFRYDATISKFNSNGTSLIYSTYLGGIDNDQPQSLIVDHNDNLIVAGRTYSNNYPTSAGCYDNTFNGGADLFVTKFSPSGALIGSTYVGGSGDDAVNISADEDTITATDLKHNYSDDARSEVIVDTNNNIYVAAASSSSNFPTVNATQTTNAGSQDAVVIELNPLCTNLLWGTYIGGSQNDAAYVLCINKTNPLELYVAGGTQSTNLATTAGSLHQTFQGFIDGFVFKFNTTTKAKLAGTYIGTSAYDQVYGIQTDFNNKIYIMGQTQGAYPVTTGVYSNPNSSQFVSILNNNLSNILTSTVFGTGTTTTTNIAPNAFLVDNCQNVYISGWGGPIISTNPGSTTGLPVTANALKSTTDGNDFYFIVFGQNLTSLLYGSFFGQDGGTGEHVDGGTSRFDENGIIYQAICARCNNLPTPSTIVFPTTSGVVSPLNQSDNCNLAALKIKFDFQNPDAEAIAGGDTIGCAPFVVQFQNSSTSATDIVWNFGDGSPTTSTLNPLHTYTTPGVYTVSLIANNPNGCTAISDTDYMTIVVKVDTIQANFAVVKVDSCNPFTANFVNTSTSNLANNSATIYTWNFGDGTGFTGKNPPLHTFPAIGIYTITLTMTDTNACNSPSVFTSTANYSVSNMSTAFNAPDSVCMPANVFFMDQSTNATGWNWNFGDGGNSTISSPSHTYTTPGVYTVYLISANPATCNKKDTAQQQISIFSSPIADFTWSPNPPVPNTPIEFKNFSTGATSYLWNFGDGTSSIDKDVVHNFYADGLYDVCLTAINEVGCKDTVCKKVRGIVVPLVDVPSGFSPNGDGVNDVVFVRGYGIEKMTFRIFNRWGEKLFESTNMNNGWDGRYKGIMQEMEVYQYTLNVTFFDKSNTTKKGSITLLK